MEKTVADRIAIRGTRANGEEFGPLIIMNDELVDWMTANPGAVITKVVLFDDEAKPEAINQLSAVQLFEMLSPDTRSAVLTDMAKHVAGALAMPG